MKIMLKFLLVISTLIPLVTFSSQVFSRELVVWSRHSPSQNLVDAFNKKMEAEGKDLRAVGSEAFTRISLSWGATGLTIVASKLPQQELIEKYSDHYFTNCVIVKEQKG